VDRERALRLGFDLVEVGVERLRPDVHPVSRGDDVIRDREDIDACVAVQVDHFADGKRAVAPRGVRVELAEKRRAVSGHAPSFGKVGRVPWAEAVTDRLRAGERCHPAANRSAEVVRSGSVSA
jgi:hypothetical protein